MLLFAEKAFQSFNMKDPASLGDVGLELGCQNKLELINSLKNPVAINFSSPVDAVLQ